MATVPDMYETPEPPVVMNQILGVTGLYYLSCEGLDDDGREHDQITHDGEEGAVVFVFHRALSRLCPPPRQNLAFQGL